MYAERKRVKHSGYSTYLLLHMSATSLEQVVLSVECMAIIGDCCRGSPLPSRNVLLRSMNPPRREKRGSVRVANMIANKGLPVELEPTDGVFEGVQTASDPSAYLPPSELLAAAASDTETSKPAQEGAGGGEKAEREGDSQETTSNGSSKDSEAEGGGASRKSDAALGAAGKMRAEASPGVQTLLQGFVPGPVTDMLAVSGVVWGGVVSCGVCDSAASS